MPITNKQLHSVGGQNKRWNSQHHRHSQLETRANTCAKWPTFAEPLDQNRDVNQRCSWKDKHCFSHSPKHGVDLPYLVYRRERAELHFHLRISPDATIIALKLWYFSYFCLEVVHIGDLSCYDFS